MFWLLAFMAALGAAFVLIPLRARSGATPIVQDEGRGAALRARLLEAEGDLAEGRVSEHEFSLVKAEIARNLFRLEDSISAGRTSGGRGHTAAILALGALAVPGLAFAIYLPLGEPSLGDFPHVERTDVPAMLSRAERRLSLDPSDTRGWLAVAPVYRRLGRVEDATRAFGMALRTAEHTPAERSTLLTELAELRTIAVKRPVSTVRADLETALKLDPSNAKARFLLALAVEEGGEAEASVAAWRELLRRHEGETAQWMDAARERLARMEIAAVMPADQRAERIDDMVAGLAGRLKADPEDLEGWLKLMRSYMVLGRAVEADDALQSARLAYAGRKPQLDMLTEGARTLGMKVE